ncbi:hypothetical protein ACFL6S_13950 [Candidatus Poribacteria bacterium]
MGIDGWLWIVVLAFLTLSGTRSVCAAQSVTQLSGGVKAVWDINKAYREKTPTRERLCINGLWRWQPVGDMSDDVPTDRWGYLKVPGTWPSTAGGHMWRASQTHYPHPDWEDEDLGKTDMAWYQREITIPKDWDGRRITVYTEYLNSYAAVYLDDSKVGEMNFPSGEVDITSACRPGGNYILSLFVVAMPLHAEVVSYANTGEAKRAEGTVERRGLCGDVFLVSTPAEARIGDVKVGTSVRKWEITFDAELQNLESDETYSLVARILDNGQEVKVFESGFFEAESTLTFTNQWKPDKLWDVHTPQNMYDLQLSLLDSHGNVLDTYQTVRFGFRELWIDGRDFWLNGTRLHYFAVPFDNAQITAAAASYDGARESMLRLKTFGVNIVYTHNYSCQPGTHLSFAEILRAADDVGMLLSFSQPHFSNYDWESLGADDTNGYASHAEFYVSMAQNHPSVVMYAMSHNATGYSEDMNPDLMDGLYDKRDTWASRNAKKAVRAEAIVERFDQTRIIYHHAGGNIGRMHTSNFYLNFVPIQERSDWFEHWATEGIKPVVLFEYGAPWGMNWTLYRGWYKGERDFGRAKIPWQFCTAEWNSQFLGDKSYQLDHMENLRFEAKQSRAGKLWNRWDYPFPVVGGQSLGYDNKEAVWAMYIKDNWRAFRTWGLSGFNIWSYGNLWKLRDEVDKSRKPFEVDWDNLQKPGFSPDFVERRSGRIDTAYKLSDWIPTSAAEAMIQNNQPLLAYIGGKPARFSSKDHNFRPGETIEKQIIIINNSRETVTCDCTWSLDLPQSVNGSKRISVETGDQGRIPLQLALPDTLASGEYRLTMTVKFSSSDIQEDSFAVHVLPRMDGIQLESEIALFDPRGETAKLLSDMGIAYEPVDASADLSPYSILIVGKEALTVDGPAPDIAGIRGGLKVLMFEQKADVLEKRLGFRIQEYGLRRVFQRVPDHAILAGIDTENLRDWRGEATIVPPRLKYEMRPRHGPTIEWCDIKVTRPWRCGNRGNVATVLIEKPARGDFLPIVDGGFNLQYSPLMEYREGKGMMLFCQMDVTGRTEDDPAATQLVANMLKYVSTYSPLARREVLYAGDPSGKAHFEQVGVSLENYSGALASDQVLVVGPGGGTQLAPHKGDISTWLEAGGHVLAIGLDEPEASAFLPFNVEMERAEHISAYFQPAGVESPLAGIGPAEVQIRDPRQLPLVTGDADVIGNGVLAVAENANVVFCQLAPWEFDHENLYHVKMTFRRTSFLVTRLLANMGSSGAIPLLSRFSTPVTESPEPSQRGRWLTGLYLEEPVEMDDPYRFFRW